MATHTNAWGKIDDESQRTDTGIPIFRLAKFATLRSRGPHSVAGNLNCGGSPLR